MTHRPALARGAIDGQAWLADGSLGLAGWYATFAPTVVAELQVRVRGEPVAVLAAARLASPDIGAKFPYLAEAGQCRFELQVQGVDALRQANTLVEVVPRLSSGEDGLPLYALVGLALPVPSAAAIESIGGGFLLPALEFLRLFVGLAEMRPDATVLDIGCGIGRMAYALVGYLGPAGRYLGFDVMRDAIASARDAFAADGRFTFTHIDLGNSVYNPAGVADARAVRFPCASGSADLGVMTSVATHLRPLEVQHYFAELGRCLRPGGRALVTAFCMTQEALGLVAAGQGSQPFQEAAGCFVVDPAFPERAIAFRHQDLSAWLAAAGLRVEQWYQGDWCGRPGGLTYQDVFIVAR